jgi:hypothetical protein
VSGGRRAEWGASVRVILARDGRRLSRPVQLRAVEAEYKTRKQLARQIVRESSRPSAGTNSRRIRRPSGVHHLRRLRRFTPGRLRIIKMVRGPIEYKIVFVHLPRAFRHAVSEMRMASGEPYQAEGCVSSAIHQTTAGRWSAATIAARARVARLMERTGPSAGVHGRLVFSLAAKYSLRARTFMPGLPTLTSTLCMRSSSLAGSKPRA